MSRLSSWSSVSALVCFCTAAAVAVAAEPQNSVRFPAGHPSAGLPVSDDPLPVYHKDRQHPLNKLHRLLFIAEITPEEINGSLPRELEAGSDAAKPWYFRKRAGTSADRKLFGGDVRVSPVLTWPQEQTEALLKTADEVRTLSVSQADLGLTPLNRLMLQWDILSVWWRLEQLADTPPEVSLVLAKLIQQTSQPKNVLDALPTGWEQARAQFQNVDTQSAAIPYFPTDEILATKQGWVELSRRSTKLFVSPQSMRSSRVFLKLPEKSDLATWMGAQSVAYKHPEKRPPQRIETAMVLCLIGITPDLEPVSTPFIDEIRFRTVYAADESLNLSETTTRDGSNIWLYFVDRQETFSQGAPRYRFISGESQAIFPEYGSAKHAAYTAQCSLCHRLANSGNQTLAGVRSLSTIASAKVSDQPTHRQRLAELQMSVVTQRLKQRLEAGSSALPPATFDYRSLPGSQP